MVDFLRIDSRVLASSNSLHAVRVYDILHEIRIAATRGRPERAEPKRGLFKKTAIAGRLRVQLVLLAK